MAGRFSGEGQPYHGLAKRTSQGFRWTGEVKFIPGDLDKPLRWRKPSRIFVNSMSDLFQPNLGLAEIQQIFDVMNRASHHQFQILTKRPERMAELAPRLAWTPNIWAGTTIESAKYLERADRLRSVPAQVRWLSCEPLLSSLAGLDLTDIHWVVAAGESGAGFREMDAEWAREIRDLCAAQGVPFHFKQWAGFLPKKLGRELDGIVWDQYPR